MSVFTDLTGESFGRLLVIGRATNNRLGNSRWFCVCQCGKERTILGSSLKNNHTQSCGCLRREITKKQHTKHGHRRDGFTKVYSCWNSMIQRCTNPNDRHYGDYGERGISVCEEWLKFKNFLEDMGEPSIGLQIDRIDNDKQYCKSNCRWATKKQQMRNRRNNVYLTHNGEKQLLVEWADRCGVSYGVLWERIYRYGWSTGRALTTPVREQRRTR